MSFRSESSKAPSNERESSMVGHDYKDEEAIDIQQALFAWINQYAALPADVSVSRENLRQVPQEIIFLAQITLLCLAGRIPQAVMRVGDDGEMHTKPLFDRLAELGYRDVADQLVADGWNYHLELEQLIQNLNSSPEESTKWLKSVVTPLYKPIQELLDNTAPSNSGFNNHELEHHIFTLQKIADVLMQQADFSALAPDEKQKRINQVYTAIYFHDTGNIFSRNGHSILSVGLMMAIFGKEVVESEEISDVVQAIFFHDEKTAIPQLKRLLKVVLDQLGSAGSDLEPEFGEDQIAAKFFELRRMIMSDTELVLRLADKIHSGSGRVRNTKIDQIGEREGSRVLEDDAHFGYNLPFRLNEDNPENNVGISNDSKGERCFTIRLDFDVTAQPDSPPSLTFRKRRTGERQIYFPDQVRRNYKEQQIPYFKSVVDGYLDSYKKRIALSICDAFTLYPDLDKFILEFCDRHDYEDGNGEWHHNNPRSLTFSRNSVFSDIYVQLGYDICDFSSLDSNHV